MPPTPVCPTIVSTDCNLAYVQQQIAARGLRWVAAIATAQGTVSSTCGPRTASEIMTPAGRADLLAKENPYQAMALPALPSKIDWRNHLGQDWVGPALCQGWELGTSTETCVAFATCAVLESRLRILMGVPGAAIKLSESQLYYCGRGHGEMQGQPTANPAVVNPMADGWDIGAAMQFCNQFGVITAQKADRLGFPSYPLPPVPLAAIPWPQAVGQQMGYDARVIGWYALTDDYHRKLALVLHGPILAGMRVECDFNYYQSGVYSPAGCGGDFGHAICIVGYDDDEGCWIVRNSWGPQWGEDGFVRIAYGQCGIDAQSPNQFPSLDPLVVG